MRKFIKKLFSYFLQGLLFAVPIAATIYVIFWVLGKIDSILPFFDYFLPFNIPGLGIITLIVLITLFGYLGTFYFAHSIFTFFERWIEKAPLVKIIYSSVKDMISAFVGEKKRFTEPVLVTVNKEAGIQQVGFMTRNDLTDLGIEKDKVAVYFPFPYSFMGNLVIVPKENVVPINSSGTEIMQFVVSGGITEIEKKE